MQFTQEHDEIRRTLRAIIDRDINPQVDQWEEDGIFPAHEVFKKLGNAGWKDKMWPRIQEVTGTGA